MSLKPTVEFQIKKIKENEASTRKLKRNIESNDLIGLVPPKMYNKQSLAVAKYILGNTNTEEMKQLLGLVHTGFVNNSCPLGTDPYYDWVNGRIQCRRVPFKVNDKAKQVTCPDGDPFAIETYVKAVNSDGEVTEFGCRRPVVRGKTDCIGMQNTVHAVTADGTGYCKSDDRTGEAFAYAQGALTPNTEPFKTFYGAFSKLDIDQAVAINDFLTKNRSVHDITSNAINFPTMKDYVRLFKNDKDILAARLMLRMNIEQKDPKFFRTNDDYLRFAFGLPMKHKGGKRSKRSSSKKPKKTRSKARSKSPAKPKRKPKAAPKRSTKKPSNKKKEKSIDLSSLTLSDLDSTSNITL